MYDSRTSIPRPILTTVAVIVAALGLVFGVLPNFGYVAAGVDSTQVGLKMNSGRPYDVVGPGRYTSFGMFESLKLVNTKALDFKARDEEVLTKDRQRIGVAIAGTVHRPGLAESKTLLDNWSTYAPFYTDDTKLVGIPAEKDKPATEGLMQPLSYQAMKVCVGDKNFDDAVVGSARDVLRDCIDKELDKLVSGYGMTVRNVVVSDVILSAPAKAKLDAITESRQNTDLAVQQAKQAAAEADKTLAVEQGKIKVEQGTVQERARQDKLTADLQKQAQEAQAAVIIAKKDNERLTSSRDLEIAQVNRKTAEENAQANLAPTIAKAKVYQDNPRYADVEINTALAAAYKNTDKVIIDTNTKPLTVLGQNGQTPSVIVGGR